jgi:hypothetical protein
MQSECPAFNFWKSRPTFTKLDMTVMPLEGNLTAENIISYNQKQYGRRINLSRGIDTSSS